VTVILVPVLENALLDPAIYFPVDVLSLSNEQILSANAEPHADLTQTQPTTDYASLLALRSSAPIASLTRIYPSWRGRDYADRMPTPDRVEQELLAQVGTTSGSA
jgi:hypothetical protein